MQRVQKGKEEEQRARLNFSENSLSLRFYFVAPEELIFDVNSNRTYTRANVPH